MGRGSALPLGTPAPLSLALHLLALAAGLGQAGLPQLVAGRAIAQRLAFRFAVAGAEDVSHVRVVLEGVGVLFGVALDGAQLGGGLELDEGHVVSAVVDVEAAGAVAAYGIGGNGKAESLYHAAVSLIGYGNLGRALAPLLRPFGVQLLVHDPWLSDGYLASEGLEPVSLDAALSRSDVIYLLAGVTADNEGFLDKKKLSLIRHDACVVLASRAEIVDFDDFLALAATGAFRAAVDVFPEEPVPAGHAWRETPNVLFSAHLAGGLRASYARIRDMMLDDIGQILKGLPPLRMQKADPQLASKMRSR